MHELKECKEGLYEIWNIKSTLSKKNEWNTIAHLQKNKSSHYFLFSDNYLHQHDIQNKFLELVHIECLSVHHKIDIQVFSKQSSIESFIQSVSSLCNGLLHAKKWIV